MGTGSERGPVALPVFKTGRSPRERGGWVRLPGASATSLARPGVAPGCQASAPTVRPAHLARLPGASAIPTSYFSLLTSHLIRLLLLGGGHSHVEVLRQFGMRPVPGVHLTLISRGHYTPYSGMLPGLIAGHYSFEDAHLDLRRLARFAGAHALFDEAVGLDLTARLVICGNGPPVAYDLLSIDIGSTPNVSVPGAAEHATAVKPIDRFLEQWNALRDRVRTATAPMRVAVVGGGAGGVELVLSVQFALRTLLRKQGHATDRLDCDHDLVRAWLGRRELLEAHGLRATRLVDDKRAHDAGFSHSPARRPTPPVDAATGIVREDTAATLAKAMRQTTSATDH